MSAKLKLVIATARTAKAFEQALAEILKGSGISSMDFSVLEYLLHKGPAPVQKVAAKVLVSSGGISYTIKSLEQRGLVHRRQCQEDKRIFYVALTEAGRGLISPLFDRNVEDLEQRLSPMGDAQLEQVVEALRSIQDAMRPKE